MDILVVDDNTNSLRSLCMVLKDLGHTPKGLQNPTDALLEAKSGLWPLIITDIRMPGMDGLSLLSAIKSDEAATKLLYLILNRSEKEWKMPPREWTMAKAQFAVIFGERFIRAMAA